MALPKVQGHRPSFVLVHGSWHTGRAWGKVASLLQSRGYTARAPTLPGYGATRRDCLEYLGRAPLTSKLTLEDGVQFLKGFIDKQDLQHMVLVGHSYGSIYASQVAPLVQDRVQQYVGAAGHVLEDGQAFADLVPEAFMSAQTEAANAHPDFTSPPNWDLFRSILYTEGSEEEALQAFNTLVGEPVSTWTCKGQHMEEFRAATIRKSAIIFKQDQTFGGGQHYYEMAQLAGAEVLTVDGSHEAVMARPEEFVEVLLKAVGV
ncbi:hypothetical protein WJX72_010938 [[Myrmecia] bisecta]|uniref:AB hydrolase-1 domain-containing protein n=1 Tax=[Myrmecia] bisecta TaxID=41462 RepID=A0AAW1PMG1_9CHLO